MGVKMTLYAAEVDNDTRIMVDLEISKLEIENRGLSEWSLPDTRFRRSATRWGFLGSTPDS